jgi:integrase/recombinase XerD
MDDWGWQELEPWLTARVALPIGPLFCIINGRTRGRPWTTSGAGSNSGAPPREPGFVDASPLTSFATPMPSRWPAKACPDRDPASARAQQPRHTSIYLQGIDNAEIIETVHARRAPMIPVTTTRSALTGTPR